MKELEEQNARLQDLCKHAAELAGEKAALQRERDALAEGSEAKERTITDLKEECGAYMERVNQCVVACEGTVRTLDGLREQAANDATLIGEMQVGAGRGTHAS